MYTFHSLTSEKLRPSLSWQQSGYLSADLTYSHYTMQEKREGHFYIFRSLHKRKEYFPFRNSLASLALLWLIPSISRWGIRIYQLWSQLHSNYKVGKEAHKNSQRKYGLPLRRGNGHWVRKKNYSHCTCPLIILHTLLSRIYIYNYWPIFTFDLESQFSLRSLFLNVSSHFINIL